jgi:hypothetical protein
VRGTHAGELTYNELHKYTLSTVKQSYTMEDTIYRTQLQEELNMIPTEYMPSLVKIVKAFREGVTLTSAEDTFRKGWQEAQSGQIYPVSNLWDEEDA